MLRRRFLRILAATTFALLVILALISQWYGAILQRHHMTLSIEDGGLKFWTNADFERPAQFLLISNRGYWKLRDVLLVPDMASDGSEHALIVPWWMLVPLTASVVALVWWFTRGREQPQAFPIITHQQQHTES